MNTESSAFLVRIADTVLQFLYGCFIINVTLLKQMKTHETIYIDSMLNLFKEQLIKFLSIIILSYN